MTDNNLGLNNSDDFNNLSAEEKETLLEWIPRNLGRSEMFYKELSSYGLKDLFEKSPEGFYISNGQFKGAMLALEYPVADKEMKNWHFKISKLHIRRLKVSLQKQSE